MRNLMLCGWLLLPIGAWAYHEGPGQDGVARDQISVLLDEAHRKTQDGMLGAEGAYAEAQDLLGRALDLLPEEDIALGRRIRLDLNKVRMENRELPTAREELVSLVEELAADDAADQEVLTEARRALASSQYYMTWLMRLEGLPRESWEPEIEAARQNYRLLAEQAKTDEGRKAREADLESAVQLARMELQDLQGLPLPSQ